MAESESCVFCRIVAGTIPCFKLWEDEATLAFMDVNPANPGHALAIAKKHAEDVYAIDPDDLAATAITAQRVARAVRTALAPDGINLIQANGPGAGQSVFHFHIHIMPRRAGDDLKLNWGHTPGDMAAIKAVYEEVKAAVA
jgi:histidine triad (HIT) family protein